MNIEFSDKKLAAQVKQDIAWNTFRDAIAAALEDAHGKVAPYDMGRIIHSATDDYTSELEVNDWSLMLAGLRGD